MRRSVCFGLPFAAAVVARAAAAEQAPTTRPDGSVLRVVGNVAQAAALAVGALRESTLAQAVAPIAQTARNGEVKGTLAGYRGIRLTSLLDQVGLEPSDHSSLKRSYVVAGATDGYAVVFSWSELYNTPVGAEVYVLLEKDGAPISPAEGPMTLISGKDLFTGPRHVRNLCVIEVRRA